MTLTEYKDIEQGTEEWFAVRRGIVTASTVGQLLTIEHASGIDFTCPSCGTAPNDPCQSKTNGSPIKTIHPERTAYATAHPGEVPDRILVADTEASRKFTAELVCERILGWSDPAYMNADMERGHDVEPIARNWYSDTHQPVTEMGFMVREDDGFTLGFSPDGLVAYNGFIEVKAPRAKRQLMTHIVGGMPSSHMAQIQAGLLVTGRDWCDFISFYGGMPPYVQRIYPDQRWFDAIPTAVKAFEVRAAEMQAKYQSATAGLATTERTPYEMEMRIA